MDHVGLATDTSEVLNNFASVFMGCGELEAADSLLQQSLAEGSRRYPSAGAAAG